MGAERSRRKSSRISGDHPERPSHETRRTRRADTEDLAWLCRNQGESWAWGEGKKERWQKERRTAGHEILRVSPVRGTKAPGSSFFLPTLFLPIRIGDCHFRRAVRPVENRDFFVSRSLIDSSQRYRKCEWCNTETETPGEAKRHVGERRPYAPVDGCGTLDSVSAIPKTNQP